MEDAATAIGCWLSAIPGARPRREEKRRRQESLSIAMLKPTVFHGSELDKNRLGPGGLPAGINHPSANILFTARKAVCRLQIM
jgi:hypothetical protein